MRAIQINPYDLTVTEVDITSPWSAFNCNADTVRVTPNVQLYLDDIGLQRKDQRFFTYTGNAPAPFYGGIGIMVWQDETGEVRDMPMQFDSKTIASFIVWLGGAEQVEASIRSGSVVRPSITVKSGEGPPQKAWEWSPDSCKEPPTEAVDLPAWDSTKAFKSQSGDAAIVRSDNRQALWETFHKSATERLDEVGRDEEAFALVVTGRTTEEDGEQAGVFVSTKAFNANVDEMRAIIGAVIDNYLGINPGDVCMRSMLAIYNAIVGRTRQPIDKKQESDEKPLKVV